MSVAARVHARFRALRPSSPPCCAEADPREEACVALARAQLPVAAQGLARPASMADRAASVMTSQRDWWQPTGGLADHRCGRLAHLAHSAGDRPVPEVVQAGVVCRPAAPTKVP